MEPDIELIAVGFRFWLGAVFLVAGFSKLGRRRDFERAVQGYGLLPTRYAPAVAAGLPPFELGCGVLLAAGLGTVVVAVTLAVLLAVFTFAVSINLARGRRIDCGCFGAGIPRRITWSVVVRNVGLAAMAVVVAVAAPRELAVESLILGPSQTASHSEGIAALIASTAALAVVALAIEAQRIQAASRRTAEVMS